MVGLFAALKLRLLVNGFRVDTARLVGFILGLVWAAATAGGGAVGLALLRKAPDPIASDVGVLVFTALALGWALLPLFLFGMDETLDPVRLAPLPLRRHTLVTGLLTASFIGVPAAATFVVLVGTLIGLSAGPLSILLGTVAIALELTVCVALSRALSTTLSGLLRSRRGRDLSIVFGLVLVFGFQAVNLAFQRVTIDSGTSAQSLVDVLARVTAPLRWTPSGAAAHAIGDAAQGRVLVSLAELAVTAAGVALLLWWWSAALGRALVGYDASTSASAVRSSRTSRLGALLGALLPSRVGAVTTKELRYFWREPQRKAGLIGAIAGGVIMSVAFTGGQFGTDGGIASLGMRLAPCIVALTLGLQAANQFGLDGAAWWINVTATSSPRDFRADITGKLVAIGIIAVPLLLALCTVLGVVAGDPWGLATAFTVGCGMLGISLGLSTVTSVLAPYPVPERQTNVFSSSGSGRGLLITAYALGTFTAAAVIGAPIVVPFLLGEGGFTETVLLLVLAPLYGAGVAWAGGRAAAALGYARTPEILGHITVGSKS